MTVVWVAVFMFTFHVNPIVGQTIFASKKLCEESARASAVAMAPYLHWHDCQPIRVPTRGVEADMDTEHEDD